MKDDSNKLPEPSPYQNVCLKLDLNFFKVKPCTIKEPHLPKCCPYYHDPKKDRRRPPQSYSADMCMYVLNEQECPYGDNCTNSHNRVEEFYHPAKYKTRFCSYYPSKLSSCEYGDFCCFAHSEADIAIDLLHLSERDSDFYMFHYKTAWCPFNETNHDREKCVYAHNWQDYRRKPYLYSYRKEQCPNWSASKIINIYFDGCPNGLKCQYSHGWKEQEFHPLNYKVNPCRYGDSCIKPHCPFYHSDEDRRLPIQNVFTLVPKNRAVGFPSQGYPDQHSLPVQSKRPAVHPTNPPMLVGSPMEGLQYHPVFMSPHVSPYVSPHVSPHMSPHVSPHISPHTSPKGSPKIPPMDQPAYYAPPFAQHQYSTAGYYQLPYATPQPIVKEPVMPYKKSPKMTTKAAPFIPKQADRKPPPVEKKVTPAEEDSSMAQFLRENGLGHLSAKFSKYGLNESFLMSANEERLSQLGLTEEDKAKLLEALEKTKKAGQRALANLVDFE